jgi:predicted GNAT family acetyltransferase
VDVRLIEDPGAFLEAAAPLLLADEARHNLLLGLATTLRDHPSVYPDQRLWVVEEDAEVVGAALRTPPHNLVLARPRDARALEALAAAVDELPGVVGALPEVEVFASAWSARTGATRQLRFAQGIYALARVRAVSGVSGNLRRATADDRPLLLDWWRAFAVEALHEETSDLEDIARAIDHRLTSPATGLVVWEHEGPASMAGFGGDTSNGIRIGPVYTPPERRGHGYASALVAELSARLLASGRRFCFLYADLANPTSNRIYERIGYERVCESAEIAFEPNL